ncbi:MAG: hypothetical protein R2705_24710 [Ilumatobacteraceae bacterium]
MQATLTGIVAGRLFGVWGVVVGVMLNVIVFFVLAEAGARPTPCCTPNGPRR